MLEEAHPFQVSDVAPELQAVPAEDREGLRHDRRDDHLYLVTHMKYQSDCP